MRIIIANGSDIESNLGGSEMQMRTLGLYLSRQGHQVIYYFREFSPGKPTRDVQGSAIVYRNERPHGRVLGMIRDASRLKEIVRIEMPDVLYARCFRTLYVLAKVSNETGIPFVYQVPFALYPGFFGFAQLKNVRKSLSLTFYGYLSRRALRRAAQLLTVSGDEAAQLQEVLGLNAQALYNMHPVPSNSQEKAQPIKVVWINNIKRIKRPEFFVELASRCRDLDVCFVMSGGMGNGRYEELLRQRIAETENLKYIGPTTLDEANALLDQASVNVVTSASEGFPNGTIQGWLRETPTITTVDKDQVITRNRLGFHVSNM